MTEAIAHTRLIPVPKWNDYHAWPPPGGLRHLIFHAEHNGFKSAFKRVGRRILVDEAAFFACVERQQKKGRAA
ncbi:MAG: hypothetical protein ACR2KU_05835 [Gammaproteobacteria bacterium]|nr:hypothetical protein [Gammaproteobacteria bacterium]